jgi:hypothetical protein
MRQYTPPMATGAALISKDRTPSPAHEEAGNSIKIRRFSPPLSQAIKNPGEITLSQVNYF